MEMRCAQTEAAVGRHPAQPVAARPAPPQPLTDAPLGDRPWERASPGPEGTVACPGPHLIAAAIRTINNPRAILLTAGSWGQEIEQPPSPRRPGGPEQWQSHHRQPQSEPLGLPNPSTLASGRKGAWPQRWESRLQPPAASSSQLRSLAVTGVPSQASWPRPGGGAGKGAFGMRADWPLLLGADCCEVMGLGWPLAESSQGRPAQPGQGRLSSPAGNVQARGHSGEKGLPHFLLPGVPGPCRNSGLAVACLCSNGEPPFALQDGPCPWGTLHPCLRPGLGMQPTSLQRCREQKEHPHPAARPRKPRWQTLAPLPVGLPLVVKRES